ncbi:hypothetical protein MPTK1_3g23940 [Marchantia polymorpha subsp. ruderalis]|uniref:CR-type domain-containing protein n=2 Tax=Marchantia polymorpha TaxID=3197 RepID=A0AAF6B459_MARPO|nr:hypothetical protein MARPO_0121s0030 [Marchantia polymorpha]BBN06793.1 hypothetical protein Mp_3g23940 [Marchantia polymorpha subsp. ruderalis]|eukprot:PTQ30682.1 hypothetical protein MARPO_0121s0030 [Marchantia polymorpha]
MEVVAVGTGLLVPASVTALDVTHLSTGLSVNYCPCFRNLNLKLFSGPCTSRSVKRSTRVSQVQAVLLQPSDGAQDNVNDFVRRVEQTWSITNQPRPVQCKACETSGRVDCPWCKGTGFFIIGDSMLCEVPSRNTSCVVCFGQGTLPCDDCKGTGFRARWLGDPIKKKS